MLTGTSAPSPAAPLTALTSSDDYQLWAHGFALTASLYAARDVLCQLVAHPNSTIDELCTHTGANTGHLAILLRTLTAIGWVTRSTNGQHCTTLAVAECAVSDTLAALCADVYGEVAAEDLLSSSSAEAWGHHLPRLAKHLPSIQTGWMLPALAADVPRLPTMLAGAVIAPLLLELRMLSSAYTAKANEGKHEHASAQVSLALVDESTAAAVGSFFVSQRWGAYEHARRLLALNEIGFFLIERCPAFGVCLSYRPMLHQLGEATFGITRNVFKYDGGHEAWVDRKLNVIGSGFMHNRYFNDMMRVHVAGLFNAEPLAKQPRVVADMGCGDGTLLKTLFLYVREHTARGAQLATYPLTMCGVDFNDASQQETARTLTAAGVPHSTMFGDIGDPVPMQAALEARFGVTREQVLHVRSFLDHDRPFLKPTRPADVVIEAAINAVSDAAYVDNQTGALVTPSAAFFSLVEHWERWARCLGQHGLLVLEVNNLDLISTLKYMHEATSMHFDCVQAHSGQMLMPATHFSLGAATAGLLPSAGTLTYPKDSAYTRIVLQQLLPAPVRLRLPTLDELTKLSALEVFWRSDVLIADEPTLRARLTSHPTGQFVAEAADGTLVAAMYTQRIRSYEALLGTTRATELKLHESNGTVVQLLGVVQAPSAPPVQLPAEAPEMARSVGQLLRDFVLHLGRLDPTVERACGVTRCRDYSPSRSGSARATYEHHVAAGTDAGLRFHSDAGASVGELVPGYRPRDVENLGFGVMVCYELTRGAVLGTRAAISGLSAGAVLGTRAAIGGLSTGASTGRSGAVAGAPPTEGSAVGSAQHPSAAPSEAPATAPSELLPTSLAESVAMVRAAIDRLSYGGSNRQWSSFDLQASLMELGLDSLDMTKLVDTLNQRLETALKLPTTVVFEYGCVR